METTASNDAHDITNHQRRRRWPMSPIHVRYFLSNPGSSAEEPQLGEECGSETEILLKAFQSGELFFTVVVWKAVADASTDEARIIKQVVETK